MSCDGLATDIYSDYVLGTLGGFDLAELGSHLDRGCTTCQSELASMRRLWHGVALAAPVVEPRGALRKRVIASVRDPERSGFRLAWWQPVAGLAALCLAVLAGMQIGGNIPPPLVAILPPAPPVIVPRTEIPATRAALPLPVVIVQPQDNSGLLAQVAAAEQDLARQKELLSAAVRDKEELDRKYQAMLSQPKPDNSGIERQLAAAQLRAQQLENDVTEYRALLVKARERLAPVKTASLLADPNLRLVRLRSTSRDSAIEGHALVSSGSQVVFYASRLPTLPAGRAYQLWLIRGSAPAIVSAGVFQPDAQQKAVVQFNNAGATLGITTIAVTDEPESGSATPTGHKLLIGS